MSTEKLIEEAAKVAQKAYYGLDPMIPPWDRSDQEQWRRIAETLHTFWAAHTEPASGDVTPNLAHIPTALRIAADHFADKWGDRWGDEHVTIGLMHKEADRLEAAHSTRERDIRIGRRFMSKTNVISHAPLGSDEHAAFVGAHIREAVDVERDA